MPSKFLSGMLWNNRASRRTTARQATQHLSAGLVPALKFLRCADTIARVQLPQQRRLRDNASTHVERERDQGVELIPIKRTSTRSFTAFSKTAKSLRNSASQSACVQISPDLNLRPLWFVCPQPMVNTPTGSRYAWKPAETASMQLSKALTNAAPLSASFFAPGLACGIALSGPSLLRLGLAALPASAPDRQQLAPCSNDEQEHDRAGMPRQPTQEHRSGWRPSPTPPPGYRRRYACSRPHVAGRVTNSLGSGGSRFLNELRDLARSPRSAESQIRSVSASRM